MLILLHIQVFNFVHIVLFNGNHSSNFIVVGSRSRGHLLCVFFVLLEDLPLCLQVGLPHFSKVADFYVSVLHISQIQLESILLKLSILQSKNDAIFVLDLKHLHLIKKFHNLTLNEKNMIKLFVRLSQLIRQRFFNLLQLTQYLGRHSSPFLGLTLHNCVRSRQKRLAATVIFDGLITFLNVLNDDLNDSHKYL